MKTGQKIDIRELVPKDIFLKFGENSVKFIDASIINLLVHIQALCNGREITINTWHVGGKFQYRGYRPDNCTIGAVKSMHRRGKAVDFDVKGMSAEQVRGVIKNHSKELYAIGLRRIEKSVNWVHIDTKETGLNDIYEFRP